jgi:TRAP-type C4-dicarboxylate transport system substrate-binding protein
LEANKSLSGFIGLTDVDYEHRDLHENISKLIFTNRTPKTVDTIVEATSAVVDYIVNNKVKVITEAIELPNSMLMNILVDKYNERYSTLSESEKEILKSLIDSTEETKKEVYTKTLRECIDLVNESLKNSDSQTKEKLLNVKDRLLNDTSEINEDYFKNISKLVELKSSLTITS